MLKNFKQKTIGKIAERMVVEIEDPPAIAEKIMDYSKAKLAFITTAGVHLKSQDPFNIKGDPSFRLIPRDVDFEDLTITHDHYDKTGALEDINLVFPLEILRDLESEGIIGQLSQRHIGLMGYIPQVKKFLKTSVIEIGDILEEDGVDIALLSPGWYICHQSVALVQRQVESRGIRTAAMSHLPKVIAKARPPRVLNVKAELGYTFGQPGDYPRHRDLLIQLIDLAARGGQEEFRKAS